MELTEQMILLQAPNPAAAENGRKLSKKGSFSALHKTQDNTLYWGECAGSGKSLQCLHRLAQPGRPRVPLLLPQPAVSLQARSGPDVRTAGRQEL